MADTIVNGHRYSFVSLSASIDGIDVSAISSVDYGVSKKPGHMRGTSMKKRGRTRGTEEITASVEMYREDFDAMIKRFGAGWMDVVFDLIVQYSEKEASSCTTDSILSCKITDVKPSASEGSADPLKVKVELDPMDILLAGLPAVVDQ